MPNPLLLWLPAFGVFGLLFGVWQVLLADLSEGLSLSPGPLGAALTAGFVASFPAMIAGGRAADRWGRRSIVVGGGGLMAVAWVGFALIPSFPWLVGLLAVFYSASGVYDVGINAAAIAAEQRTGRRLLPLFHGAFSGGGAIGALAAGGLVAAGVPFRWLYVAVALLVAAVVAHLWRGDRGWAVDRADHAAAAGGDRWGLFRRRALLLVAAVTALGFLFEGAMETWSVVYLRRSLELPPLLGASGAAVFHAAMLVGRLASAATVARFGRRATLRGAGLSAAAGMALALATERAPVILLGFLVVGLCLAAVAPVAFSLAGDLAPGRAGEASSVITTLGYGGFLIGPSLIGGLAEGVGLRAALATTVLVGLLIAALAGRLAVEAAARAEPVPAA